MAARIAGLPGNTAKLSLSRGTVDTWQLDCSARNGLRVYDRQRQWSEVFRDTDYGNTINGVTFSADGLLATTSDDGKVRLYDGTFRLVVPPKEVSSGPYRIAFSR